MMSAIAKGKTENLTKADLNALADVAKALRQQYEPRGGA
jgi:hypothetical protein